MANNRKYEIQNALKSQIEGIDRLYLRKIQKAMFECSAKCCDNDKFSSHEVQSCVDKCNEKLVESHDYMYSEMKRYETRLERCVSQCNDEAKDQLGAYPTETQVQKASRAFENCASNCIDKHIELLPQFMSTVHEVMKKKVESLKMN